ncbi:MAG TPA: cell division protein ZapA [Acetobacteraceae bacterium]|nr:cell division protein ZapA [Acetobacteraceae bacterium]
MAQVTVRINGYNYVVGCEDGQEGHLQAMAEQVDTRIASIKTLGQTGEARLLVLAALLMADELHDQQLELHRASAAAPGDRELGERLNRLADQAEAIATHMEGAAG